MNKRVYKTKTPTLSRIGVANFDGKPKMAELKFKLARANKQYVKVLRTTDSEKIEQVIKTGILREVVGIQERNEARKYAANRVDSEDEFGSDKAYNELEFGKSSRGGSEYGRSSVSPKKSRGDSPLKPANIAVALPSALKKPAADAKTDASGWSDHKSVGYGSPCKTTFKIDGEAPLPVTKNEKGQVV